jgi:hypothetical protein
MEGAIIIIIIIIIIITTIITTTTKTTKVKLSLCLTKHHAMKTYWGSGGIAPRILDLGTRWRSVISFTPRPLYPQEKSLWNLWIGGWVAPAGNRTLEPRSSSP